MEELIELHLGGQVQIHFSNVLKKQNYDIYYSDTIEDFYWNYAYLKNAEVSLKEVFEELQTTMKELNRKPILYVTSNRMNSRLEKQIESMNLELLYTDVWMTLDNLEQFQSNKSQIDFSIYKVDETLKEQFIEAVMDGFSGDDPEDPYESLSDGYKIALERSFKNDSEYKVVHYLGKREQEPISTATVVYRKQKAIIYNVTTKKQYQRKGVCKQMMANIVRDLSKQNIKQVCVQTEQGFYPQQVYKNMGFSESLLGKAYQEKK